LNSTTDGLNLQDEKGVVASVETIAELPNGCQGLSEGTTAPLRGTGSGVDTRSGSGAGAGADSSNSPPAGSLSVNGNDLPSVGDAIIAVAKSYGSEVSMDASDDIFSNFSRWGDVACTSSAFMKSSIFGRVSQKFC
jgi:hypothetical protein